MPSLLAARPSVVHVNQSSMTCVSCRVVMQPSTDIKTAALTLRRRRRRSGGGPAARHERRIEKLCIRRVVMWLATTAEIWVLVLPDCSCAGETGTLVLCTYRSDAPSVDRSQHEIPCGRSRLLASLCSAGRLLGVRRPSSCSKVHTDQHLKWHAGHRRSAS